MTQYIRKAANVEALQAVNNFNDVTAMQTFLTGSNYVLTSEQGVLLFKNGIAEIAKWGDWVVKTEESEFYPVTDKQFKKDYETVK